MHIDIYKAPEEEKENQCCGQVVFKGVNDERIIIAPRNHTVDSRYYDMTIVDNFPDRCRPNRLGEFFICGFVGPFSLGFRFFPPTLNLTEAQILRRP